MKKLFAAIFGSSKNTETIVDGAVNGIDKLFYTDEEKAEGMEKMRDWYLRYLEASQPQNLARRFISVLIVGLFVLLILAAVIAWPFMPYYSEFIFMVIEDNVATPFAIIMGFYFAAHIARQLPRKKGSND